MIKIEPLDLFLPDAAATHLLGKSLATTLQPGAIIYLHGDLGAGKTTLVQGVLNALGYSGVAKSPTYTLIEFYPLIDFTLNHFDLYRLTDPAELDLIGIRDYVESDSVSIFEWSDKGKGYIPNSDLEIILLIADRGRNVKIHANTDLGIKMLQSVKEKHK